MALMLSRNCARLLSALLLATSLLTPALGQISVTGLAHKGVYADTVTFTIANTAGYTFTAHLNGNPVPVGTALTANRPDFYQLVITRTDGITTVATNLLFIVRASERGGSEWGLPPQVPWPVIQSSPAEFEGARLRLLAPSVFPSGYEIPVVAWVIDETGRTVRANGRLAAPGQNAFQLRRGVGSGFLASNQPPGILNYEPSVGGVTTNRSITLEAGTAWTPVSGVLAGATTWPDNSRIRVTGHLSIPAGASLTIGAGSVVLLNAGVNITNDGAVIINGTLEQPVVFTPNSRAQPWGGFFMRNTSGSVNASGTIFVASGADPTGGDGHRQEQCLFLVDNAPSITLTDCAAIYLAGQFGHAYKGGTFTLTRFLMQRATTGGEYTGASFRVTDAAFIECPDDTANFVDGDNDGLYLIGGRHGFTNVLFGWTKDDGVDSGGTDSATTGFALIEYQSCWFESTFHEGNSLSGYKDVRVFDTVYLDCGQGIEDGYNGPTGRVQRCVFAANKVGVRHGDNYDNIGSYIGTISATNSLFLWNYRDVFGYNWRTTGWTQAVGQMFIQGNLLTVPDTNFPDNAVWNPAADASRLAAYGARGRAGLALAVRANQTTLASFPDGVPVGLSMFCTNPVSVDYTLAGTDGTATSGTLLFPPGRLRQFIPVPTNVNGVLRLSLANPVNADLTGTSELMFQNYTVPGAAPTVLSPLGALWKYLDNGSDQGTAWRAPTFNDSSWSNGVGRLGFGTDAAANTLLRRYLSGSSGPQPTNYYFRRSFVVPDPSAFATVQFRYQRDDGCVVYLNGSLLFTNNMGAGPYTFMTFAASTISGAAATQAFHTNTFPSSIFLPGTNVIAVSIHQVSTTSSDIAWDLQVLGLPTPPPPRVEAAQLGGQPVLYWGDGTFTLEQAFSLPATNWLPATGTSPFAVPAGEGMRIFRLRK
ncbi:MAG: hypothetical protein RJA22_40 [Verrucomicrobiota bacterium]